MPEKTIDIAIIGGGASGLAAAISAKKLLGVAKSVVIFERLPKCGKKILATGNGRCNLSHQAPSSANYHGSVDIGRFLSDKTAVDDFFRQLGLLTIADTDGRIYPFSNTAVSVLDALCLNAAQLGVQTETGFAVVSLARQGNDFIIKSDSGEITARRIILAAGGCAAPSQGSDGSGLKIAQQLGIAVNKPRPSLCPLVTEKALLKPLSGLRVRCTASLLENNKLIRAEKGEVQFTNDYISGICIFNLSTVMDTDKECVVSLDLLDDYSHDEVVALVKSAAVRRAELPLEDLLTGIFNYKLACYILRSSFKRPLSSKTASLSQAEITAIADAIKALDFPIKALADFTAAQVTAGGIAAEEVTENLESKKYRGLYFAGEVLDVHGDCGGYNLHYAWLSGISAGKSAALSL